MVIQSTHCMQQYVYHFKFSIHSRSTERPASQRIEPSMKQEHQIRLQQEMLCANSERTKPPANLKLVQ